MPTNFPGVVGNGYAANIRCPNNADPGDTTYLLQMASDTADRTAWLKNFLDTLMPNGDLRGLTKLPSLAFLRSYAGAGGSRIEGDLVLVVGVGIYGWASGGTEDAAEPSIVLPTGLSGPGRWYLLVPVTAPASQKGIIALLSAVSTASHAMTATSDLALNALSVTVKSGDILVVTASTSLSATPAYFAQGEQRILIYGSTALAKCAFAMAPEADPYSITAITSHVVRTVIPVPPDDDGATYPLSQSIHLSGGSATITGGDTSLLTVEQYRF